MTSPAPWLFNADSYTVAEDGPEATITLEARVVLLEPLRVDLVVVDGTANAPRRLRQRVPNHHLPGGRDQQDGETCRWWMTLT